MHARLLMIGVCQLRAISGMYVRVDASIWMGPVSSADVCQCESNHFDPV